MHYQDLHRVWSELCAAGAPFELEPITVRGLKLRGYKHAPPDLRAFWRAAAAFGERDYILFNHERITYAQAAATSEALAGRLFEMGVAPGDRVAIAMRNNPNGCSSTGRA